MPRVSRPDPEMLRKVLVDEFPWLELAVAKLVAPFQIAQRTGQAVLRLPPILLAGPPGIGKSALVRAFANAAKLPLFMVQAGAGHEASSLTGLSRSWRAAEPSLPVRSIAASGVANPLIAVDEIDKSVLEGGAQFGRLVDALLALLERSTASSWTDPYLGTQVDLSCVNWILLVNDPGVLPGPLCSRLRLIRATAPTSRHATFLIERQREGLAKEAGLAVEAIPALSPEAERRITLDLDRYGDIRRFNRLVSAALNASEWPSIH
jgi:ATP-dependent Lon protease